MTSAPHPDGQVISCRCGARLFDPLPHVRTYPSSYVPDIENGGEWSDAPGAQRLAWERAHQKCKEGER